MYAVNGPSKREVQGFVIPLNTRQISSVFKPSGIKFGNPHDVSVTSDGNDIYVVEITVPYKVWKFSKKGSRAGKQEQIPEGPSKKGPVSDLISPSLPAHLSKDPPNDTVIPKDESFGASIIIMAFLTIPLLLLIAVGAVMRLMSSGKLTLLLILMTNSINNIKLYTGWCRRKETKSFAEFFPPSAGFEKLKMEESDSENSDTEVEEFAVSSYRKVPT